MLGATLSVGGNVAAGTWTCGAVLPKIPGETIGGETTGGATIPGAPIGASAVGAAYGPATYTGVGAPANG
jgi:hypothetical protein